MVDMTNFALTLLGEYRFDGAEDQGPSAPAEADRGGVSATATRASWSADDGAFLLHLNGTQMSTQEATSFAALANLT
jgi:hypothetical protein